MSSRRFAVIPAAGHSRRMGRPKLSLPWGDRTVIEHLLGTLRDCQVESLVVVGPHVARLTELVARAGGHSLVLPETTSDMRATVIHGLAWLEQNHTPTEKEDWLLIPGDHPIVERGVLELLQSAKREHPRKSVFIPTFESRRGHPALIGWKHVADVRALPEDQGINRFFRANEALVQEVSTVNPSILWDLDTPEEYARLIEWHNNENTPTKE